jgi:hypothetical protein
MGSILVQQIFAAHHGVGESLLRYVAFRLHAQIIGTDRECEAGCDGFSIVDGEVGGGRIRFVSAVTQQKARLIGDERIVYRHGRRKEPFSGIAMRHRLAGENRHCQNDRKNARCPHLLHLLSLPSLTPSRISS